MTKQTQYNYSIIGVDVSKDKLDIYFYDTEVSKTINNTSAAINRLAKDIYQKYPSPLVVMESTGGYEKLAQRLFNEAKCSTHVAHPTRVHYFAKQKGFFAKTDKIDAKIVAQYGMQEQVKPSPVATKKDIELKELSSRRSQIIVMITAEKCRIKDHNSAMLNRIIQQNINSLESQIKLVDDQIANIIASDKVMNLKSDRIQSLKGIGETTAHVLIALLPELGKYNRAGIACLCGLAPRNRDSGSKTGKRYIYGGRFDVRKAMYMPALSAIIHNPEMRTYYQHLKSKGKPSKVAIVAVMRKLIITLNAMIRDEKDWCSK